MKRAWLNRFDAQFARINALGLRERVFLFLALIGICMALVDGIWLSPAQLAQQQLTQRFDKQSAELQRARDELKSVVKPADANQALRDEIAAVNARLDTVNQTINGVSSVATEATPLAQVLVHLLRRHEGLTLLRTSAVASDAVMGRADQALGAAGAVGAVGVTAAVLPVAPIRQGVELTVSGSYPELIRYVQTLENALPNVRWGSMKLKTDEAAKTPPELTLQLFLVR